MAAHTIKNDSTGYYVVVVSGDTLSAIAAEFRGKKVGDVTSYDKTWQQIAALNNIQNRADLIYIGEKIYLVKGSGGNNSSSTNDNKATVKKLGIQTGTEDTLLASWTWSNSNTDNYETWWDYDTGDGVWFVQEGKTEYKYSTFPVPENAKRVRFYV